MPQLGIIFRRIGECLYHLGEKNYEWTNFTNPVWAEPSTKMWKITIVIQTNKPSNKFSKPEWSAEIYF